MFPIYSLQRNKKIRDEKAKDKGWGKGRKRKGGKRGKEREGKRREWGKWKAGQEGSNSKRQDSPISQNLHYQLEGQQETIDS